MIPLHHDSKGVSSFYMVERSPVLDHANTKNHARAVPTLLQGSMYSLALLLSAAGCQEPVRSVAPVPATVRPDTPQAPRLADMKRGTDLFDQTFILDDSGTEAGFYRCMDGIRIEVNGTSFLIASVYVNKMEISGKLIAPIAMLATAQRGEDDDVDVVFSVPESADASKEKNDGKKLNERKQTIPFAKLLELAQGLVDGQASAGNPDFTYKLPGYNILLGIKTEMPQADPSMIAKNTY